MVTEEERKIFVVCGNKKHLNELVSMISLLCVSLFKVEGFAKTSDLRGRRDKNVILIVLSLIGGEADPPWDIFLLRRRFQAPIIVEVTKNASEVRRYRLLTVWKAYEVFDAEDDVCDVIRRVSPLDEVLPPPKVCKTKTDQMQNFQKGYMGLTKQAIEPQNVVISKS